MENYYEHLGRATWRKMPPVPQHTPVSSTADQQTSLVSSSSGLLGVFSSIRQDEVMLHAIGEAFCMNLFSPLIGFLFINFNYINSVICATTANVLDFHLEANPQRENQRMRQIFIY